MNATFAGYSELVARLDAAVDAGSVDAITSRVKADLEDLLGRCALDLPERFRQPRPDCYARRLLHADPAGRYTAVVMTWGPGQSTPVHDHGGLWCVEGVVDGEMAVTQFNVAHVSDGSYDVTPYGDTLRAGTGSAGRLIPPTDYHVLGNARADAPSVTLHVYGGSLDGCRVFLPRADGRFEQHFRSLTYHE
jgi:predicted metal-dependent enzyme (double-stranded beta helix superfamily)